MVEYVLGGSPTNKESPLSALEPRLRNLKFDDNDKVSPSHIIEYIYNNMHSLLLQSHDDKEKANSPFDTNGLKKDDQVTNTNGVVVNGIDDDKGFKWVQTDHNWWPVQLVCNQMSVRRRSICTLSPSLVLSVCQSSSSLGNGIDIRMPIPSL